MIQPSLCGVYFNHIGPQENLYHRCIPIAYFAKYAATNEYALRYLHELLKLNSS